MAGAIGFSERRGWSVAWWLFDAVVNYVAETVADHSLSVELRVAIESRLRYIDVRDLSTKQAKILLDVLADQVVPKMESEIENWSEELDKPRVMANIRELAEMARAERASRT